MLIGYHSELFLELIHYYLCIERPPIQADARLLFSKKHIPRNRSSCIITS